jgi:hypothetical protein
LIIRELLHDFLVARQFLVMRLNREAKKQKGTKRNRKASAMTHPVMRVGIHASHIQWKGVGAGVPGGAQEFEEIALRVEGKRAGRNIPIC